METELEFHPLANLFPLMTDSELKSLADDIEASGLKSRVVLLGGKVLDGRNRVRACEMIGHEIPTVEYKGKDPLAFVLSLNLHRRHMTPTQLAALGSDIKEARADEAKARMLAGKSPDPSVNLRQGKASELAAAEVGVSAKYVEDADMVRKANPSLFAQMKSGEKTLTAAKREIMRASLAQKAMSLPDGEWGVLYADPPWEYNDELDVEGYGVSAGKHYPTMSMAELKALDVAGLAADNSVMFMWATVPLLPRGLELLQAWGFEYKTHFVWDKVGHYVSVRHELLLLGTRGKCQPTAPELKLYDSVQSIEKSRRHSEKPEEFRAIIDAMYPAGPRIELFARERASGWDAWGNEGAAPLLEQVLELMATGQRLRRPFDILLPGGPDEWLALAEDIHARRGWTFVLCPLEYLPDRHAALVRCDPCGPFWTGPPPWGGGPPFARAVGPQTAMDKPRPPPPRV